MSVSKPGPAPVQCPRCGEMLNEDDLYCRFCGQPMVATGFDQDNEDYPRPANGTPIGGPIRAAGDRPTLNDPLAPKRANQSALSKVRTGSLGCTALIGIGLGVLIALALITFFVIRPAISDAANSGVRDGIARELSLAKPDPATNVITLDETTINEYLAADEAWFDPLHDMTISLNDNQASVDFGLYGMNGTFSAGMTVQDGLIRLVSPHSSGTAGRLIDADQIAKTIESELRAWVQGIGRPVSNVAIQDGTITITFGS
jgi:hypothetical protein